MGRFETRVQFKQSKFSTVFLRSFYFAFAVSAVHFLVPRPPVFVFISFSNRFMDSLVVVQFLLAWVATHHGETMPFTNFESIGNTLLQVVALCNFPTPMKELFDWGNILCHLRTLLPPEIPDNRTIQTLCVRAYPTVPNWLEYNMPSDATVAPLHRGVVEPLYKH